MDSRPQRLHLGCGHIRLPNFINVDILALPAVDQVVDLQITPWPWDDNCCEEIIANHLIEHLSTGLLPFMDESWRVLRPGGTIYLEVPDAADLDLAWADPEHYRPYRRHSFINYLTIPGVRQFGYTRRAWSLMEIKTDGSVIVCHATPVKPEIS